MPVCQSICTVTATPPSKREDYLFLHLLNVEWTHLLCLTGHWQMWCHQKLEKCFELLWRSSGWLHISSARDTGLIPGQGTKVRHATWCGQICLLKSAWLWKFALSCCSWNLEPLCEGENKPELACWVVKGVCPVTTTMPTSSTESSSWLAGDCRDMSEQRDTSRTVQLSPAHTADSRTGNKWNGCGFI